MNWQRARTDEKKNERKEAIHKAAFTLFKKNGYDNVSLLRKRDLQSPICIGISVPEKKYF